MFYYFLNYTKKKILAGVFAFFILPLFLLDCKNLDAAETANYINYKSEILHPVFSKKLQGSYELWQINFVGNSYFPSQDLLNYLLSKPTQFSFPHKVLNKLQQQAEITLADSNYFLEQLEKSLKSFEKEYQYFNIENAEIDCDVLQNLYNANGFHFAEVHFIFDFDSLTKRNTLTFFINEKERYHISSLNYLGLDNLPPEIASRLERIKTIKSGDFFDEFRIEMEIRTINSALLNSGFMDTKIRWDNSYPNVIMDTLNFSDSITCFFDIGERISFGKVIFIDSTNGQKSVANSTKRKMILFKEGDVYAKWRIDRSIENLLSMGTFESISIDTMQLDFDENEKNLNLQQKAANNQENLAKIKDFVVKTSYRKLREWDVGFFFDQTQIDNLFNTGFNGSIKHHNLFGSAQTVNLFFDLSLKDLNYFLSTFNFPDYKIKVGGTFSQPLLWMLGTSRVGLSASLAFSLETVSELFKVAAVSLPIRLPIRLSRNFYFDEMQIEFNFERDVPLDFHSTINSALENARNEQDSINIRQTFTFYENINNYMNEPETHILTSNILSVSLRGDSRNHPFSPTVGDYTFLGLDGLNVLLSIPSIAGAAKYFRAQIFHNRYWQLSKVLVAAAKLKLGMTYLQDAANAFVPFDRQFFAGGANSVRAWTARTLRYYKNSAPGLTAVDANLQDFATNYIGSRTLIEGSFEFRRKLSDLSGLSESFQWIANDLGMSLFVDFGNAFGWYRTDTEESVAGKFTDYFTKLAVGTGFGFHYETPVGPIRLDFATPVYDPMRVRKPFSDITINFGIGHSF